MNFLLTIARKGSILPSSNKTYITCRFVEIGESYEQTNVLSDENEVNQQTKERVTFYVCRNFGSGRAGAHRSIFCIPLLSVLVLAYVLCGIQVFVVESALIKFVGKLSPVRFFKGIWPAATVAFTSQSSVGTIPVTVNQLTRKLGVNEDVAAFGASLGANLGMPGCAGIWPTLLAVFTIHLLGIEYTPVQYAFLVVLAVVVSIGTVGVPGTATITATALFAAAGLPVEAIILLSPISSIVDMARTATNVVGAATATTLVAATEEQLDTAVYNGTVETLAAEA